MLQSEIIVNQQAFEQLLAVACGKRDMTGVSVLFASNHRKLWLLHAFKPNKSVKIDIVEDVEGEKAFVPGLRCGKLQSSLSHDL